MQNRFKLELVPFMPYGRFITVLDGGDRRGALVPKEAKALAFDEEKQRWTFVDQNGQDLGRFPEGYEPEIKEAFTGS